VEVRGHAAVIVERVLADLDIPDAERRGNPIRGSRLGRCARQSAYMLYPDAFPPEPLKARAKLVFRFGDMIHELVRAEFRRVLPGSWGAEEMRFHFRVPLSTREAEQGIGKICRRELHGQVVPGFDERDVMRGGLVLVESEPALYVPLHVDGIAELPGLGLATAEIKSMATGSFRMALRGHVEYSYRVQMACAVDAAGLDTELYVAVRKDSCHVLEVVYSRKVSRVDVIFTKSSKVVEAVRLAGGDSDDNSDWESALVQHPFEPHLLEDARARVRRILLASPANLPGREYGPDFTCRKCRGDGARPCARCKRTGRTKTNKPCGPCKGVGRAPCAPCKGTGKLEETELPFQCSYCPFTWHCWRDAGVRLELDERPHYRIRREDFERSRITFAGPGA
jgi:hypothetical protein